MSGAPKKPKRTAEEIKKQAVKHMFGEAPKPEEEVPSGYEGMQRGYMGAGIRVTAVKELKPWKQKALDKANKKRGLK
jgi:hypothetical protein